MRAPETARRGGDRRREAAARPRLGAVAAVAGLALAALLAPAAAAAPATLPSLTSAARVAVAAADDDGDRIGEAVRVVLAARIGAAERPSAVDGGPPDPVRPLDRPASVADPEAWRGAAVAVAGRLEQVTGRGPRSSAGAGLVEWFVRTESGPVAVVLVAAPDAAEGDRVTIAGRFIRRIEATARDGRIRRYPQVAAWGGDVTVTPSGASGGSASLRIAAVAGPLLAAGIGFAVVRRLVRRTRRRTSAGGAPARPAALFVGRPGPPSVDAARPSATLPADPAAALAELRRRAAEPDSTHPLGDSAAALDGDDAP